MLSVAMLYLAAFLVHVLPSNDPSIPSNSCGDGIRTQYQWLSKKVDSLMKL